MSAVFALRAPDLRAGRTDQSAARWTAFGVVVALVLLFAFFFRMEESVAQNDAQSMADAEWTQRHWQCSALPVIKQGTCEAQLAGMAPAPADPLVSEARLDALR